MFRVLLYNTAAAAAKSLGTQTAPLASPVAFAQTARLASPVAFARHIYLWSSEAFPRTLISIKCIQKTPNFIPIIRVRKINTLSL